MEGYLTLLKKKTHISRDVRPDKVSPSPDIVLTGLKAEPDAQKISKVTPKTNFWNDMPPIAEQSNGNNKQYKNFHKEIRD
jgi:hypothetical protein